MARFAEALVAHPAPTALGDVSLRYAPSMLIGETHRQRPSLVPSAAWTAGVSALLVAVGLLVLSAPSWAVTLFVATGGLAIAAATRLEHFEKRRRAFVANFATVTLRLDFVTPLAGYPRTLLVPFDAVRDVSLVAQADGLECLTVDFVVGEATLREVLVAFIAPAQREAAERLQRVLRGAFGLGGIPADSPYLAADVSTFG